MAKTFTPSFSALAGLKEHFFGATLPIAWWLAAGLGSTMGAAEFVPANRPPPDFAGTNAASSPVLHVVSRVISKDTPGFYRAIYTEPGGVQLRAGANVSADNGRTWKTSATTPDFAQGLAEGFRRAEVTSLLDSRTGRFLTVLNALDEPGLDPKLNEPSIGLRKYYLRYRVSSDGVNSWEFDEPMVQGGSYTPLHPFAGVWIGTNSIFLGDCGCIPIVTRSGRILVPAQATLMAPSGKLWNPAGSHSYTEVLVLIGNWTNGHRLNWKASQRITGDPKRSTRGLIEPTLAPLPDGRLLMVMRGSNGGGTDPHDELPSYKWMSVSRDEGESWSEPKPWTGDDGKAFFSPSSMSTLFRHSSGRIFWVGNLTAENCRGDLPRWPLVIGEVNSHSLALMRASLLVVDTERPEDRSRGRLDLSHFTLLEDRETRELVLVYPRAHNAYQTREWATIRLTLR